MSTLACAVFLPSTDHLIKKRETESRLNCQKNKAPAIPSTTHTHGHFVLSPVSLELRNQDGGQSNSTMDIYILKYLSSFRDGHYKNLGDMTVLAREMFSSGCRPRLKNGHALSSLRHISIYTLSDLGVLSNLIGSLSLANEHYSPPTE